MACSVSSLKAAGIQGLQLLPVSSKHERTLLTASLSHKRIYWFILGGGKEKIFCICLRQKKWPKNWELIKRRKKRKQVWFELVCYDLAYCRINVSIILCISHKEPQIWELQGKNCKGEEVWHTQRVLKCTQERFTKSREAFTNIFCIKISYYFSNNIWNDFFLGFRIKLLENVFRSKQWT